jgi:hypothetical protein
MNHVLCQRLVTARKRVPGRPMQFGWYSDTVAGGSEYLNHLTPNGQFSGRTAQLTYRWWIFLFIQQIYVLNILNMLHTLRFFLFKMSFIS